MKRSLPTTCLILKPSNGDCVSIAGSNQDEFVEMAKMLDGLPGVAAVELNISCPNVAHGVDFGADWQQCSQAR
ncbi:MAG: hypothetical protein U0894_17035 [Pirellulales bacterium]